MADLFTKGMAWLAKKQKAHCAVTVIYERWPPDAPEPRQITVTAVLGRPGVTGEASVERLRLDSADVDFILPAAGLVLDGQPIEPAADDRVILVRNGIRHTYEVLPHGNGPAWRWSDPQHTLLRVYARLTDTETSP